MKRHHITRRAFALSSIAFTALTLSPFGTVSAEQAPIPKPDGKPADMTKPVQVFILLGQSNMVGMGRIAGGEGSLENAVKNKNKYSYLVDDAGAWIERKDVRFVRYMSGKGPLNNEWLGIKAGTIGPEYGIGHVVGNAIDAPVMILKCSEFKGNVATVYSNPLSLGGSGNGHYGGNAETYMNVGEAMGQAMVELLKNQK